MDIRATLLGQTFSWQFFRYLISGVLAVVLTVAAYWLMVHSGIWYVTASVLSDGVGFVSAFLLHKYLVFQKAHRVVHQAVRYTILQVLNVAGQAAFLYVLVEYIGIDKVAGRVMAIGVFVPLNFFAYKYLVYV